MTSNPSDIGHTSKLVFGVNIKDVLDGEQSTEQVSTSRVNDTLRLAGRTRSLQYSDCVSILDDESRKVYIRRG
jgi:hypothetical protein